MDPDNAQHFSLNLASAVDKVYQQNILSPSYTVTIPAMIHRDSSRFEPDCKIGIGKRKSGINTVSHDAPTVSARFSYGSTTTRDGSATIHHGGATNAHDTVLVRFRPVASRPPTNVHDLVVVM